MIILLIFCFLIMDWEEAWSSYSGSFVYVYSNLLSFFNSFTLKQGTDCFLFLPLTTQSETALSETHSLAGRMQDAASLIKFASSSEHRLHFWPVNCTWRLQLGQTPAIPKALPAAPAAVTPQRDARVYWYRWWLRQIKGIEGHVKGHKVQAAR